MSLHTFDPKIAKRVGIAAAVIYQNLMFWIEKNVVNEVNEHDGLFWTYNSVRAWSELFGYLTEKQIRRAIDKLKDEGLIVTGNYNKNPRDRTTWYAIPHLPKRGEPICPNGNSSSAHLGEPLPDINTDITTDNITPFPPSSPNGDKSGMTTTLELKSDCSTRRRKIGQIKEFFDNEFELLWKYYPRKVAKAAARSEYQKARKKATFDEIKAALGAFIRLQRGTEKRLIPHLRTWLHQERWNDEQADAINRPATTDDQLDALNATTDAQLDNLFPEMRLLK